MLYGGLLSLVYPILYPYLAKRYRIGFDERRGIYDPAALASFAEARPLWLHAVSVGEVQSAAPFVRRARRSGCDIPMVLSTVTPTGRAMAYRIMEGLFQRHIYYPWDVPHLVRRALEAVRPRAYMAFETEIWPEFLKALRRRHVPAILVNARLSERSFKRCRKWPSFWRRIYELFELILVRAHDDMDRFRALGLNEEKLVFVGDCKVDALKDRRDVADLSPYRHWKEGNRPLFLAGSTHEGEEGVVLAAFARLREQHPGARLVIAPRHPERAFSVLQEVRENGFSCGCLSESPSDWSILVVDRVGVLFNLYGVADGAFVGGSLVPRGGQNILEPACWGVPVQHGPHMEDFALADGELLQLGAASVVRDEVELAGRWLESLRPEVRQRAQKAGGVYFSRWGGASSLAWSLAEKHIEDHTR